MRVPENQARRFDAAVCERLGLDPAKVSKIEADSDGVVTVTAHLPAEEIVEMFNRAGQS